jgi:hypothetical protein
MGLRKGDLVRSRLNGIEGIILGFKTAKYNGYYHKAELFCIYSPHNPRYTGKIIEINAGDLRRKE